MPSATDLYHRHEHLVPITRKRAIPNVPAWVDIEDLHAVGMGALWEAIQSYDPTRSQFTSWAMRLMRYAMIQHIRDWDEAPRPAKDARKRLMRAEDALLMTLGRPPSDLELAAYLGTDLDGLDTLRQVAIDPFPISLEDLLVQDEEGWTDDLCRGDALTDPAPGPEEQAGETDEAEYLWREVASLPRLEAYCIIRHDGQGAHQRQVAQEIGKSPTRVFQTRQRGFTLLRERLGAPPVQPKAYQRLNDCPLPGKSRLSRRNYEHIKAVFRRNGWDLTRSPWPHGFREQAAAACGCAFGSLQAARLWLLWDREQEEQDA